MVCYFTFIAFFLSLLAVSSFGFAQVNVTDLSGRALTFNETPKKIILGESRYLAALSILYPEDPIKLVVGMLGDLKAIDRGTYNLYEQAFPAIKDIPLVGHTSADSFSVENVISLGADIAIFGVEGHGPTARHSQLITQLEKAGVQVIFIDFRQKPIENTIKSITLLGEVLGREERAEAFLSFYRDQLNRVKETLKKVEKSPQVFIHSRAGLHDHCCETMVKGMMAGLVDYVKGDNIASERVPGYAGTFNLEYLLVDQPDIYIATAIGSTEENDIDSPEFLPYVHIGNGVNEEQAQLSFKHMLRSNKLDTLTAIQEGKAHAIWHNFYNSPLNVIAIQVFATWLYPEEFVDFHPEETMAVLFDRFQATPLQGEYWMTLDVTQ